MNNLDAARRPHRFGSAEDLTSREHLEVVLGTLSNLQVEPLQTTGFSGSEHKAVRAVVSDGSVRRLVVKRITRQTDWTHRLSDSTRCREVALLATPSLVGVWKIFVSPYLAFFENEEEAAVLMEDLTPYLLPDVREPLIERQEQLIVRALTRLHAMYWDSPILELPWLTQSVSYWSLLGPERMGQEITSQVLPPKLFETFVHGWQAAFRLLPAGVVKALSVEEQEAVYRWSHLRSTLLHGDVKVANFALRSNGEISAFDWALVGRGPVSVDLGWYIAVNATRLTGSKEKFLQYYRRSLETELGFPLDEKIWREIITAAILIGARMLLWSKAAALSSGDPAARVEWEWWANWLEEVC
jgi:phosphotransferase family enzyme